MKPGPAPTPSALRLVDPDERPRRPTEPRFRSKPVPCPSWLSPAARKEWRRIHPELRRLGLLTKADRGVLAAYCDAYARWAEAVELLRRKGFTARTPNGYIQQRPEVAIVRNERAAMLRFAQEFGFSPAARTRIDAGVPPGVTPDSHDDFTS